ncbi:acyl-[acyl-carrier-protein] thioesterase [Gracilimonas mengyeensis]|uniref:Acyl-ACP thioesterase n=1 Tax=Gracilimonas mengyeensis TaxID=1302730 RepID=A0A521F522_9BACT|nr:acyl-ACP thioesterase domain-containing protein [Gracilimonas mengyeensis]SMO91277.1 Acyl-ACP thioesterase [Gracilimonas mengyeensis]
MPEHIAKYSESFKIRASEVDTRGKATLPALCSLFQEVAGNNALQLNFDITQLHEQNLTWVLHRMDIHIERFPDWRETITIETWPAAGDALRAYRDYRILDEEGNQIGACLSYWMMINLETRRPTRMPKEILEMGLETEEHVLPIKTDRLNPMDEFDDSREFTVRKSDLDMNRHVNNARYVEWMMEPLPEEEAEAINRMDIVFVRESTAGDTIHAEYAKPEEGKITYQLKNQDGMLLALAECLV